MSYPFTDGLDFVRNAWYVAGWSHDFTRALAARRYLDEAVVMYRTASGEVSALADRCAHRAYPLSLGSLSGDQVVCGYHGFTYEAGGCCTRIPSQAHVPASYAVRRYPTLERAGIVWIWMGRAEDADESSMPDLFELGLTDPAFHHAVGDTSFCKNRYQLTHENLLDLSHIGFLHPGSIGTPHVTEHPVETRAHDRIVEATRLIANDEMTIFHKHTIGRTGRMDRTTRSVFMAPSAHVTHVTMVAPGTTARLGEPGYFSEFKINHLITPVSKSETLYFWAFNRTAMTDDDTTAFFRNALRNVFDQDRVALEMQEKSLTEDPGFSERSCKADEASIKARRLLEKLMREEREARVAVVSGKFQS